MQRSRLRNWSSSKAVFISACGDSGSAGGSGANTAGAAAPKMQARGVFGFGFHDSHPQRQFDIYYDDLALNSKRVGCAAKQGAQKSEAYRASK